MRVTEVYRRHPWLTTSLVIATVLALFFLGRFTFHVAYWSMHREEPVQGWMTVGYIGRSWDLNPRDIDAEAGLPPPQGHPLTLNEIASGRQVPVEEIIAKVEAAIAKLKVAPHD